jgi:SnoaL-like domain
MDTRSAARSWAETWRRSWVARDPEPIAALYAPAASYATAPFRTPHVGPEGAMDYVAPVLAEETDVRAWFGEPIVDGDRAAVRWWASLREAGEDATLAGTSVLRFDADGLVVDQWDAWHLIAGRSEPPSDWT